jgi:hypothetical protein
MKYTRLFLFILSILLLNSCAVVKDGKPSIVQGVFGQVREVRGNQMPSPDVKVSGGGVPVLRTVQIYQLTHIKNTEGQSPLFTSVKTVLVGSVKTDKSGYFQCKLPAGKYSIFTKEEDGKLFASLSAGDGQLTPFEVKENEITRYDIMINHRAAY